MGSERRATTSQVDGLQSNGWSLVFGEHGNHVIETCYLPVSIENGLLDEGGADTLQLQGQWVEADKSYYWYLRENSKLFGAEDGKKLELNFSLSNVKSKYKDASLPPNWKAFDTLIFNDRVKSEGDRPCLVTLDEMEENRCRVTLIAVLISRPSANRFLWEWTSLSPSELS
ncbi:hypothetical protein KSP39_PZI023368 [Platanthera zijinensis]|uniref:Uncharacterized protein n=1 Tax=Platanthera zijinensis TaxID=2320716 RepID=A0AAP0AV95_9ASPA